MKKLTDFKNKREFFAYLVANKAELIALKKTVIKRSDAVMSGAADVAKILLTSHKDDLAAGVITRTIIGNTYNWMDSHDDVHLDNVFQKSISERGVDKIWHLHDHEHKITAKVGKPIKFYEKMVAWKDLGVDKAGETMALFMDSAIRKDYNPLVYDMYLNGEIQQHSVGMRYVKIDLALNDSNEKAEFALWNQVIGKIGNREKVEEQGYFWAVKEAALIEKSAVLAGSNELTPTLVNEEKAELSTKEEILAATKKLKLEEAKSLYESIGKGIAELEAAPSFKRLNYNYLVNNLDNALKK